MSSFLTKEMLDEYWEDITEKAVYMRQDEILYFTHCTTLTARRGICLSNTIAGHSTDMPFKAPLSRNKEIEGVWFEIHPAKLATKSPYGNRRLTFKTKPFMKLLSSTFDEAQENENEEKIKNSNLDYNGHFVIKEKISQTGELSLGNYYDNAAAEEDDKDDSNVGSCNEDLFGVTSFDTEFGNQLQDIDPGESVGVTCSDNLRSEHFVKGDKTNDTESSDSFPKDCVSFHDDAHGPPEKDENGLESLCKFEVINDNNRMKMEAKAKNVMSRQAILKSKRTVVDSLQLKYRYSREDFLKDHILLGCRFQPENSRPMGTISVATDAPCLFLECCHFYGNKQYLRFVMIKSFDRSVGWCKDNLKSIDIHDNPFLKYNPRSGRIFSVTRQYSGKKTFNLDILVVGDIPLDYLSGSDTPHWDKVSKLRRAGRDPIIGIMPKHH